MVKLLPNMLVILVTGAMLATLLKWTAQRNRKAYVCVSNYCAKQGWVFREQKERQHNAFVIQTDRWRLTTGAETLGPDTQGVASGTEDYTRWESLSRGKNPFAL
ncbi:MAG: hypothetical protein PHY64_05925, partial [Eubacteriales bacterium]|nr:hypothetical protein [Eubacteriales bacterium]